MSDIFKFINFYKSVSQRQTLSDAMTFNRQIKEKKRKKEKEKKKRVFPLFFYFYQYNGVLQNGQRFDARRKQRLLENL